MGGVRFVGARRWRLLRGLKGYVMGTGGEAVSRPTGGHGVGGQPDRWSSCLDGGLGNWARGDLSPSVWYFTCMSLPENGSLM